MIEPGKIGEATEGRLVSVTGPVSRLGDRRFRVGDAAIFLEKQAGITTAGLTEGCPATVIGLSAAYDSPQIWPRSQADVIPGDCTPAACEPLTISQIQGSGDASPYRRQDRPGVPDGLRHGRDRGRLHPAKPGAGRRSQDLRGHLRVSLQQLDQPARPPPRRPGGVAQLRRPGILRPDRDRGAEDRHGRRRIA